VFDSSSSGGAGVPEAAEIHPPSVSASDEGYGQDDSGGQDEGDYPSEDNFSTDSESEG